MKYRILSYHFNTITISFEFIVLILDDDHSYQIGAVPYDYSVSRSLDYYTITFGAAGLFVLFCIICITTAEFYKAKKAYRAVVLPSDGVC